MIRPGRGIADRAYPRLVESEPAWVPDPPPLRAPVGLYIAGAVALSWFACIGIAWTAYAVCRLTGLCK
ncbi:MAG: hypothetical protein KAX84_09680 [Burkholderiales bacterium]|nr:hypothetical protein [Burkholderiales bacterium]